MDFVLKLKHHASDWEAFIVHRHTTAKDMPEFIQPSLEEALYETNRHFKKISEDLVNDSEIAAAKAPIYLKLVGYTLVTYLWGILLKRMIIKRHLNLAHYFTKHETSKIYALSTQLDQDFSLITTFKTEDF